MRGRIVALFIIIVLQGITFSYYHFLYGHTPTLAGALFALFLLFPAWWIGKQFDTISTLKRKLESRKEELIEEIQGSEERYKNFVEQTPNIILTYDEKGNITYANEQTLHLLDAKDCDEIIGRSIFEFMDKSHHSLSKERTSKAFNNEKQEVTEYKVYTLYQEVKYIESVILPFMDRDTLAIMVVGFDITKRKKSEELRRLEEQNYRTLIEALPISIIVHREREIIWANSAAIKLTGFQNKNALVGLSIFELIAPSHRNLIEQRIKKVENGDKLQKLEVTIARPDGSEGFVEVSGLKTSFLGEEVTLTFIVDITERKQHIQKIKELAYYDTLTSLPNRNMLVDQLNNAIKNAIQNKKLGFLLFLDLDLFKNINDTYGHSAGDELLIEVANRIKSLPSLKGQFISRYGGDEMIIIIEGEKSVHDVTMITEEIINSFKWPITVHDVPMYISTSIGISIFPRDGKDVDTIIKNADIAMYKAKESGRNSYKFYSNHFYELNRRWMEIERELRFAIENGEFSLAYQPKINLQTEKMIGSEALLRWKNEKLGQVSPAEFIPVAEETGLIISIGNWVLEETLRQTKEWIDGGWTDVKTAVNVSVLQLKRDKFLQEFKQMLTTYELDGSHIVLEITESLIRDEKSLDILHRLKEMGVYIAMDDFGTGYSSLSILKHVPIDYLKIDKSFIDDIHTKNEAIVKTIIDMGYNLDCKIVAEGIETIEQKDFLRHLNCHLGQGYYFSRPVTANKITGLNKS